MMIDYSVYLVTQRYDAVNFLQTIERACQSGVTVVQLREKSVTTKEFYTLGLAVKAITDRYGIPLIINDRIDICLALDASGVHIGDDELPVHVVRQLLPNKIIGVSAKTVQRAIQAQQEGADYLGVGAIFPTQTKVTQQTSIQTLKHIAQSVTLPVVAIGGITQERIHLLQHTSIAGVAMVSELMCAKNVCHKVMEIVQSVKQIIQ